MQDDSFNSKYEIRSLCDTRVASSITDIKVYSIIIVVWCVLSRDATVSKESRRRIGSER